MSSVTPVPGIRLTREEGQVALITIGRPPVNALNWDLKRALVSIFEEVHADEDLRCVVFASDLPRTFCAGSDLHELTRDHSRRGSATERTRFEFDMWQMLSGLPKPSVAAVEGHALGSGMELAIACDFRIAGANADFGLPEIRIGGAPGIQTLARLPFLVGYGAARRMLLIGASLDAAEAYRVGLVDQLVPAGEAVERAMTLARTLAAQPASSMKFLRASLAASMAAAVEAVEPVEMGGVEELFLAPEMHEGIQAFIEKRQPDFQAAVAAARAVDRQ